MPCRCPPVLCCGIVACEALAGVVLQGASQSNSYTQFLSAGVQVAPALSMRCLPPAPAVLALTGLNRHDQIQ